MSELDHPAPPGPHIGTPLPPSDKQPAGTLSYALGFLGYLPLPIVSNLVAGIAMAAAYPSQRRRSALAAENARRAANWGLTMITVTLVAIGLVFALLGLFGTDGGEQDVWVLWPFLAVPALGVAHLVVLVLGLVNTTRGTVFRNPLAIPFLRASPDA